MIIKIVMELFCALIVPEDQPDLQKKLQEQAYKIVEHIGVIGGTNVQFAHDPVSGRVIVIEINPRTSRSSALASKATGFPIALVSAKLATGLTLKELKDSKYGTLDKYVPGGEDQEPILEQDREIVRTFNSIYGETLVEPYLKV